MKVKIDSCHYLSKPDNREFGYITRRLSSIAPTECTPDEVLSSLCNGQTIMPGICANEQNTSWQSQQLFLVDIDGGLSFSEAKRRWESYDLKPCFVYEEMLCFLRAEYNGKTEFLYLPCEEECRFVKHIEQRTQ